MKLANTCIEKPVLTIVISLVLILFGLLGFKQLELRANPQVFRPKLIITVESPGSSAEYMEQNVTIPLENRLQDTANLSFMSSNSQQNIAEIKLYFKNITQEQFLAAQSQVESSVSQTQLPENVDQPQIESATNDGPQLIFFSVSSSTMGQHRLVDYVANNIVRRLQEIPGVGSVYQYSTKNALRINLNPKKMALLGVATSDVLNALAANNVSEQAGQVINNQQSIAINFNSRLKNIDQFKDTIIKHTSNRLIQLKDIATIAIDHQSFAGAYTYYNGKQGVGVSIAAADDANPITLGNHLRKVLTSMQQTLPPGTHFHILWDESKIIKHSVLEVFGTILEAVALVALVTFLFLGNWRFALIPIVTIPVCIISAFAIIWLFGFSINLMTLLALVLAVGLVVDDAIVVLENCHRHVESGLSVLEAAKKSMSEITFPVIGMTISIIAVYLPTAFMRGKTAVYFQQFAFTLAGAVFISGIVALTLTPMMCSRLIGKVQNNGFEAWVERRFESLKATYQKILAWVLNYKWIPVSVFVAVLSLGILVFSILPTTLIPNEYGGFIFVGVYGPDSASVNYTQTIVKKFISEVQKMPEVSGIMSFGGGNGNDSNVGANFIRLKAKYSSAEQTKQLAKQIGDKFKNLPQAKGFSVPMNVNGQNDHQGQPGQLSFYLTGFTSYLNLAKAMKTYVAALNKTKMFQQVDNQMKFSAQQYDIDINRLQAAQLNVPIQTIDNAISTFLGGYVFKDGYQFDGVNYPVIVQLPVKDVKDLSILKNIYLKNNDGADIALNRLVNIKTSIGLPVREHINGMRAGLVNVVAKSNYTGGQIINTMQTLAKQILPSNITLSYTQHALDMLQGNNTMLLIFVLGIVFIYLILAALFESFIDPLIILFTIPLCIVGALFVLKLIGGSLNIYTGIGLVTLIGLVAKHGVLITQFANNILNKEKVSIKKAVLKAATIRIRPILMTTATMVMGALPLVFASGIGSNARSQIGYVIVAGLILGTFFSLFIVPVAYSILAPMSSRAQSKDPSVNAYGKAEIPRLHSE